MRRLASTCLVALFLAGCGSTSYWLVSPGTAQVTKGGISVNTTMEWNRMPTFNSIREEEGWTLNGAMLDLVTFMGGIEDGGAITKQREKDDRQVPIFKADMTPPELVSMIESHYRIKAGTTIFETTEVKPVTFVSNPGMQIDYRYVTPDDIKRRGRTVLAVVDGKLYLMSLDGTDLHYFDAALPEFDAMVQSATIS